MANLAALIFEVDSWPHGTFHVPAHRSELETLLEGWGEKTKALVDVSHPPPIILPFLYIYHHSLRTCKY